MKAERNKFATQINVPATLNFEKFLRCGSSSAGRASRCQREGRGFESRFPLKMIIGLLNQPIWTQSYWRDEAFSVLLASHPWWELFGLIVKFDHTPRCFITCSMVG